MQNIKFYLFADCKVILLKTHNSNYIHEYVNDLLASSVTCLINKPSKLQDSYRFILRLSKITASQVFSTELMFVIPNFVVDPICF